MKKFEIEITGLVTVYADDIEDALDKADELAPASLRYNANEISEGNLYEVRKPDVWGNFEDGWEINDSMVIGEVFIDDTMEDDDVIDLLIEENYLDKAYKGKVTYSEWGDGTFDIIQVEDSKPILGLNRM